MEDFEYPISVTACRYVTEVGGRSRALGEDRVGIHIEALRQNTEFSHDDRVLLNVVGKKGRKAAAMPEPLFIQTAFKIEPLRGIRDSRLLSMSSNGEAVLPRTSARNFEPGDEIVLNSAVDRMPEGWIVKQIHERMGD